MTIASEITKLNTNLTNSYTACQNKGATMPANQNFDNLATCVSSIPTATEPTLASLTVTPSTTTQTITPPSGTDGYNTVQVSAVTAAIDSDIVAGNIKSGCNILGVNGTVTELVGTTTTITQNGTYAPTSPSNGFTSVSVNVAGTTPSGTYTITANGTYDVTNYASANVSVSGGGGSTLITKTITQNGTYNASSDNADGYSSVTVNVSGGGSFVGLNREVVNGVYEAPTTSFTFSLPSNATDIGDYAMYYAFAGCTGLTSVDLSSLTTVSGANAMDNAFNNCTNLTSIDLSSLTTVNASGGQAMQYAFAGCIKLTSIDLSSLTTVSGNSAMQYAFYGCTGLTSIDLSSLETIGTNTATANYRHFSNCFNNCNALTSITFPKLEKIYCTGGTTTSYGTFANNNKVQKMYFPKLDTITYGSGASSSNQNACKNVFYGCSALTELHFGAANQSAIEASPGYSTAWGRGAGNVTIYFDL